MGWRCPHHSCDECGRKAQAAGGLLFRCAICPHAYCEDHLPPDATVRPRPPWRYSSAYVYTSVPLRVDLYGSLVP
jgi:hypothetical protein